MEPWDRPGVGHSEGTPKQRGVGQVLLLLRPALLRLHLLHQGLGHPGQRQMCPHAHVSGELLQGFPFGELHGRAKKYFEFNFKALAGAGNPLWLCVPLPTEPPTIVNRLNISLTFFIKKSV